MLYSYFVERKIIKKKFEHKNLKLRSIILHLSNKAFHSLSLLSTFKVFEIFDYK